MPTLSSSPPQAGVVSSEKEENPELSRFRAEWLAELQRRKEAPKEGSFGDTPSFLGSSKAPARVEPFAGPPQSPPGRILAPGLSDSDSASLSISTSQDSPQKPAHPVTHPALDHGVIQPPSHVSTSLEKALKLYRRAIEHEQKSELDDALLLYRQAFRLEDNVDRAYRREEMLTSILKDQQASSVPDVEGLATSFKEALVVTPPSANIGTVITGTLASLVKSFLQEEFRFQPENEAEPVILNLLPEELLVVILGNLDPTSIERFARVCKKGRVISLDPGIWRKLVRRTYQPPQITDYETLLQVIEKCSWDFRRVYIEQPRVRLDGVYIATCHYVRPGLSENSWVNTSHLITYHRYLRFYPNGQVLSLLANEEHSPQQIIPILKPTLRMNGLFFGQWKLIGTRLHLVNLIDASGRFALPVSASVGPSPPPEQYSSTSLHASGSGRHESARYMFAMILNLRSRPLGRWNRMDIENYESINIETGNINPIMLKHERAFWFSKVRSYA